MGYEWGGWGRVQALAGAAWCRDGHKDAVRLSTRCSEGQSCSGWPRTAKGLWREWSPPRGWPKARVDSLGQSPSMVLLPALLCLPAAPGLGMQAELCGAAQPAGRGLLWAGQVERALPIPTDLRAHHGWSGEQLQPPGKEAFQLDVTSCLWAGSQGTCVITWLVSCSVDLLPMGWACLATVCGRRGLGPTPPPSPIRAQARPGLQVLGLGLGARGGSLYPGPAPCSWGWSWLDGPRSPAVPISHQPSACNDWQA